MIRVFTGYDKREAQGWHAFIQSLIETSTDYVIAPTLTGKQIGGATNAFTLARFKVPELCHWSGLALYVDASDMLLMADVAQLADLWDQRYAVQVVKHKYQTKHPRKYVGTEMETANSDYPRKNWSSVMLFNAGHRAHFLHRASIRDAIAAGDGAFLHRFAWLEDHEIGELPLEWNWLADEYGENEKAKLLHWTAGYPGFKHYRDAPMSAYWHAAAKTLHSER